MKLKAKRRTHRVGPLRVNRAGLRLTSITVGLGPLWSGVLWQAKRRPGGAR